MNKNRISMYFITAIDSRKDDTRCVGYTSKLEDALKVVENNYEDLYETCYDLVVIEHIPEGIYEYDFEPLWFKYNEEEDKFIKLDKQPEQYKNQVGFAIG